MKKVTITILIVLAMLQTRAQDYLISFAATGDTTGIGAIMVNNLISGAAVTLKGGDSLHLYSIVGIGSPDIGKGNLQIYPNPMVRESVMTFVAPESGDVVIRIVDLAGRTVCQSSTFVSGGSQRFRISGIGRGVYFITVTGKAYTSSGKLVSKIAIQGKAEIECLFSGNDTGSNHLKSATSTVEMPYTDGDMLMYKGMAGQYSAIVTDVPTASKTITFGFFGCTDNDGRHYATVQIGAGKTTSQVWMAENLNVGVRLDGVQGQTNNSIIEKYCSANLETNCDVYGGLYQWGEMVQYLNGASNTTSWNPAPTGNIVGICPVGWHLPTEEEWCTVTQFLDPTVTCSVNGMDGTDIGAKMKETGTAHWTSPNTGATNSSGFTVLPGGYSNINGTFGQFQKGADFWPASEYSPTQAWDRYFYYNKANISRTLNNKAGGYSVRCVKN
jgi:uncharacterized protein (TIGR02145 family)